jgi:uncharacterized protein YlaI
MNGYCGDCDKQVELVESHIEKEKLNNTVYVYLVCPWCDEKELITTVDTD